jgi:DNA-binding protein H-NS
MKNLEGFDSIDDLKQAIQQLTQKYETLRQDERAAKIAEAKELIENYSLTAEELGLSLVPKVKKSPPKAPSTKGRLPAKVDKAAPTADQQGFW